MNTTSIPTHLAETNTAPAPTPAINPIAPAKLFSIQQIGLATFLAVPAGLTLLAMNFRRIGKIRESNWAILLTPIATVALIMLGLALPEGTPTLFIPLFIALGVKKLAMGEFTDQIAALESNGGRLESGWTVVSAVIAGMAACIAIAIGLITVLGVA